MSRILVSPILFACMAFFWTCGARAQAPGVGFTEALASAEKSAPALRARQSQTIAAQAQAAQASALPDPKLILAIDSLPITGADRLDFNADDMTMKRVGLMQEFPARAKRKALQALADRTVDESLAASQSAQFSVRRATAEAWLALWVAEQELHSMKALQEQSLLTVRLAKARLAGGAGSVMDALATQAAALALENRLDAAAADVQAARSTLARWLDRAPEGLTAVGEPPDLQNLPAATTLLSNVDSQAPLLTWRSREAVAQAQVELAVAGKRPDWSVAASYGQRAGQRSDMLMVEFAIDLPLFSASRQDHLIAARRADFDALAALHEDARREQMDGVRRTLAQWQGLKQQVARQQGEMLPLEHDRSLTALASYRAGGDLQAWLDARRDELELHAELARDLGALGQAWAALAFVLPANTGAQP